MARTIKLFGGPKDGEVLVIPEDFGDTLKVVKSETPVITDDLETVMQTTYGFYVRRIYTSNFYWAGWKP